MTHENFARLRSRVTHDRRRLRNPAGVLPLPADGVIEGLRALSPAVTGAAGDWVREDRILSTGAPARWHRFSGDLSWAPEHAWIAASVQCSVRSVSWSLLWSSERPTDGRCKRCSALETVRA